MRPSAVKRTFVRGAWGTLRPSASDTHLSSAGHQPIGRDVTRLRSGAPPSLTVRRALATFGCSGAISSTVPRSASAVAMSPRSRLTSASRYRAVQESLEAVRAASSLLISASSVRAPDRHRRKPSL